MPVFKTMDSEAVWKALDGHEDMLTPLVKKEEAFFRHVVCPICASGNHESFLNVQRPFTGGVPLSNKLLRCLQCRTEFDPYSQLVTKVTPESD